ncbi:unnamed protein product [Arctogadus glacialis]
MKLLKPDGRRDALPHRGDDERRWPCPLRVRPCSIGNYFQISCGRRFWTGLQHHLRVRGGLQPQLHASSRADFCLWTDGLSVLLGRVNMRQRVDAASDDWRSALNSMDKIKLRLQDLERDVQYPDLASHCPPATTTLLRLHATEQ